MSSVSDFFVCSPNKIREGLEQIEQLREQYEQEGDNSPLVVFELRDDLSVATPQRAVIAGNVKLNRLRHELYKGFRRNRDRDVILDLSRVEYLSGAALPKLAMFQKLVQESGCALVLCGLRPRVRSLFRVSDNQYPFTVEKKLDNAAALLRQGGGA